MTDGYIKLFRSSLENNLYKGSKSNPFDKWHAWEDILLNANFKESQLVINGEVKTIYPGEWHTSLVDLSERWHWSRDKVSRFLNELELLQMIHQKRTYNGTTLTVENWGKFQLGTTTNNTTNRHQTDIKPTADKSHKNKERKKERNNTPQTPQKVVRGGEGKIDFFSLGKQIEEARNDNNRNQ